MKIAVLPMLMLSGSGDRFMYSSPIPSFVPRFSVWVWSCWTDVAVHGSHRLQRNVVYDCYRVLGPSGQACACGSLDECDAEFARRCGSSSQPHQEAVVLIHGILRNRHSMNVLSRKCRMAGYDAIPFEYAATQAPIQTHADDLGRFIRRLPHRRIHFVCHSMGGLVLHQHLAGSHDPRIGRVVFLGTPIRGSEKADYFKRCPLFHVLFGPAGVQLTTGDLGVGPKLPPLQHIELAVIAGNSRKSIGPTFMFPGPNDGSVAVERTKLPGAKDFMELPLSHLALLLSDHSTSSSVRFLQTGRLRANGTRNPIPVDSSK